MNQKVVVTIKIPSQNIKMELSVPEMEVEDVVNAISAQCEDYEVLDEDYDDVDLSSLEDDEDLDIDDFAYED